jgi:DNA mismatch endonuclease (patch repair protein)
MSDVLSREQRRRNMSRIRGRDTKPEMLIRRGLHARGLRYKLHDKSLPGRPDLVFPRHNVVAFIHGCFWHVHGCALSKQPTSNRDFWSRKLEGNVLRDQKVMDRLKSEGWRLLVIWECALRGTRRKKLQTILDSAEQFILTEKMDELEIEGEGISSHT